MTHPPPRSQPHASGTARNTHDRDHSGSHSASQFSRGAYSQSGSTVHGTRSTRSRHGHSDPLEDSDQYSDSEYNSYDRREEEIREGGRYYQNDYQNVPRPREFERRRELQQVVEDPFLDEAIAHLSRTHRQSTRPSGQTVGPHPPRRPPPANFAEDLEEINRTRHPMQAMGRYLREGQRSGPHNAAGEVGRRSEYDQRGTYGQQSYNGSDSWYEETYYDRNSTCR